VALASLLLGWLGFLAVTTLLPCCKLATAQAQAPVATVALITAAHAHAGPVGSGHHHQPADSCASLMEAAHAMVGAAAAPSGFNAKSVHAIDIAPPRYPAPGAAPALTLHPPLPPPRAAPAFHLRTSRILI